MKHPLLLLVILGIFAGSCTQQSTTNNNMEDSLVVNNNVSFNDGQQIIDVIPSPLEAVAFIQQAGLEYREDFLHDPKKADNYLYTTSQAMNIGVYSIDLTYAAFFGKTQSGINYMAASQKLLDKMQIVGTIDKSMLEHFEKNMGNRDSVVRILSDLFMDANAHMLYGKNPLTGTLAGIGAWAEGAHILSAIQKEQPQNKAVTERILDQRFAFETLLAMLKRHSDQSSSVTELLAEMARLESLFAQITVSNETVEVTEDTDSHTMTIKTVHTVNYPPDLLENLAVEMTAFREYCTR